MNETEPKTIIVTGGSGFIGGTVCRLLVDAGHNVINIDRVKKDIPGVSQYPFDIDSHQVKGIIQLTKPDTIMHFAADHEVGRSVSEPGVFYWNNVGNTIALLNHAVEAGVKNFIFSSSSSVYGNTDVLPTTETEPTNPVSTYAKTKVMVEQMLDDYKNAYGLNYVSLRYFNAAGAVPDLSHGYTQSPPSHLIPIIAKSITKDKELFVFGDDYSTVDGTAVRDYTHVSDIASAHIAAMNYLDAGRDSDVFNIGAGVGHSILEVINVFKKVAQVDVPYTLKGRREGDVEATCADTTKAQEVLGWHPSYSIEDIVAHAYEWEKKQK